MKWINIIIFGLIAIATITGCSDNKSSIDTMAAPTSFVPESNDDVINWELKEVYFEETNVAGGIETLTKIVDGCAQDREFYFSCDQVVNTGFQLSVDLSVSLGLDSNSFSISPDVTSLVGLSSDTGQNTPWETPYGFIDTYIVETKILVNKGKGTFFNLLDESVQGNLTYLTGGCNIDIILIERKACDVVFEYNPPQPTIRPTNPTPVPTQAPIIITATPEVVNTPQNTSITNQLNEAVGNGNWFCFPHTLRDIGINMPSNFQIQSPFLRIEYWNNVYTQGDVIAAGGAATASLIQIIDKSDCPNLIDLIEWTATQNSVNLDSSYLNNMLGNDTWRCGYNGSSVSSIYIPGYINNLRIQFPFVKLDSQEWSYGVGETVSTQAGTLWLATELPSSECPN